MLYQIEGSLTRLLGTMHLVPGGQEGWVPYVKRSLEWSERLVFEMRPSRGLGVAQLQTPHGTDLPSEVRAAIEKRWIPDLLGAVDAMSLPGLLLIVGSLGLGAGRGVEGSIVEWRGGEDAIDELESPQEFVELFDEVPSTVFVEALRRRLGNDLLAKQNLAKLYRAWRGQNGEKLLKVVRTEIPEVIRTAMFDVRNRLWAPRVAQFSSSTLRTLVCVGAGHLHGPGNLRELLQRDFGLKCTRIEA